MKVQDVFIYFYYLGREDQVRYTVLGKRIHVSKGLGTRPSALYGTWQKDTCEKGMNRFRNYNCSDYKE